MEKEPVDTNATIITKDDVSKTPHPQDDDTKPDYSSKATTKTKFSDYLRIFTYSTWMDRVLLVSKFDGKHLRDHEPRHLPFTSKQTLRHENLDGSTSTFQIIPYQTTADFNITSQLPVLLK